MFFIDPTDGIEEDAEIFDSYCERTQYLDAMAQFLAHPAHTGKQPWAGSR
jgi:hypothetical protein